jgi:hypothetical protein
MVQTRKQKPNSYSFERNKIVKANDTNGVSKINQETSKVLFLSNPLKEAQKVNSAIMSRKDNNLVSPVSVQTLNPSLPLHPMEVTVKSSPAKEDPSLSYNDYDSDDSPANEFVYKGSFISIRRDNCERNYKKWIKIMKETQLLSIQEKDTSSDNDSFVLAIADIKSIGITGQLTTIPLHLTNEGKLTLEFSVSNDRTLFIIELSSLINSRRKGSITTTGSLSEKSLLLWNQLTQMDSIPFLETTIKIIRSINQQKEKPQLVRATIHPFDTVYKLKSMFENKKGIMISDQTLLLNRKIILENDKTFYFYNISKNSELLLLI